MTLAWQDKIEFYALILVRVSAALAVLPIYGDRRVPVMLRVGLAALVAALLVSVVRVPHPGQVGSLLTLAILIFKEAAVGLALGFVSLFIFLAMQFGGQIIGFQMGFAIVNVVDPQSQQQVSLVGQFEYLTAVLLFLVLNGHHLLLAALARSFDLLPPLQIAPDLSLYGGLIRMSAEVFVIGVKIAAPAMAALLLTNIALSIIARTVPQMNIFIVGFPIGIAVGLAALAFSAPLVAHVFRQAMAQLERDLLLVLQWL